MMDQTHILDDCLRRLASGQGRTEVLALYPEQAHRLAPLLDAAVQLAALSGVHLSDPQKLRAKVALRQALAERAATQPRAIWPRLRALPVALILAAVLVTALSISAVASSKPGDMAYPLRIAIERVPTLVQLTPAGRAAAELDIADRRMADLGGYLSSTGRADPITLDALLEGDAEAAGRAARLSGDQRAAVAARIMAHAAALETLAGAGAAPADALRLRAAAGRSRQIVDGLRQNSPAPAGVPTALPPASGDSRTALPEPTAPPAPTSPPTVVPSASRPTEAAAVAPTSTPAPTDAVLPTRTPRPRPRLTVAAPPAIVTRQPGQGPRPTRTPDPGATVAATAPPATRVRPTSSVTRQPTLIPPQPTRTPLPGLTPGPTRTPWRAAATPLPTRTPWSSDRTPLPTRTSLPPDTATRVRPWPPRGTPIPTAVDTPVIVPADTSTPVPAETPVITPAETPTPDAAGCGCYGNAACPTRARRRAWARTRPGRGRQAEGVPEFLVVGSIDINEAQHALR